MAYKLTDDELRARIDGDGRGGECHCVRCNAYRELLAAREELNQLRLPLTEDELRAYVSNVRLHAMVQRLVRRVIEERGDAQVNLLREQRDDAQNAADDAHEELAQLRRDAHCVRRRSMGSPACEHYDCNRTGEQTCGGCGEAYCLAHAKALPNGRIRCDDCLSSDEPDINGSTPPPAEAQGGEPESLREDMVDLIVDLAHFSQLGAPVEQLVVEARRIVSSLHFPAIVRETRHA